MTAETKDKPYAARGTVASWYRGWELTDGERDRFRQISLASHAAKVRALKGECDSPKHAVPTPKLNPLDLMPRRKSNGLNALSLFSGCGGMDIGFDRAGYQHVASYDILPVVADVLKVAKPAWKVFAGDHGDVTHLDWKQHRGVDIVHGGPPCQPFSLAGNRKGSADVRDMIPELVRAVLEIRPRVFVMENVAGLATQKFAPYLQEVFFKPLKRHYQICSFMLEAASFGVPQRRRRVFFVGFADKAAAERFDKPAPTHSHGAAVIAGLPKTMGAREALGLHDIGRDGLAPTIRSGWTGPRNSTSIVNSATALKEWAALEIWPNGVAPDRAAASAFIAKNGDFRLSIADCMVLQGFPPTWPIKPPVYKALGLIGNSVSPPMGYSVACSIAKALRG